MSAKEKIHSVILQRVMSGEYAPGAKLPTERDFSVEFETTLWTIHSIMNDLEESGFIERRRAAGTFVRDNIAMSKVVREKNRSSKTVVTIAARDFFYTRYGFEDIIGQMESSLSAKGYNVVYEDMPKNPEALDAFLENCASSGIGSIVIFPERAELTFMFYNSEALLNFPGDIFYFNRGLESLDYLPLNCVSVDMTQSGKTAASWAVKKGLREIVFSCGEDSFSTHWLSRRHNGFKYELDRHGVPHKLITGKTTELVFKPVLDFIRKAKSEPLIAAANDQWAAEIYDCLDSAGLRVNRDYRMIGFDNHPGYRNYKFSTVAWPLDKVSGLMADAVIAAQSAGVHSVCSLKYLLKPFVIERESTLAVPRNAGKNGGKE
jgi:DNA-binding LacI/PurR family transcriptional regulator